MRMMSLLLFTVMMSCQKNKSINLSSLDYPDRNARVQKLREYFNPETALVDAHYLIIIHDNSTGLLSGPSDWYYLMALKVSPDSLSRWTAGFTECTTNRSMSEWGKLELDSAEWNLRDEPQYYCSKDRERIILWNQGIVLTSISSN